MLVIAFHEFGHAITACCTGGKVESISLDPHEGGVTHMRGGVSAITLPAGYLGSSLIGALLTFCGFNTVASKVASIVLGVCFLLVLWWGECNSNVKDEERMLTLKQARRTGSQSSPSSLPWALSSASGSFRKLCGSTCSSSASCRPCTQSGTSATISSCEKSTPRTQANLRSDMVAHRSVGVSYGV
jgi:hypothetical protein